MSNLVTPRPVLASCELRDPSGRLAAAAHLVDLNSTGYRVGTEAPIDASAPMPGASVIGDLRVARFDLTDAMLEGLSALDYGASKTRAARALVARGLAETKGDGYDLTSAGIATLRVLGHVAEHGLTRV